VQEKRSTSSEGVRVHPNKVIERVGRNLISVVTPSHHLSLHECDHSIGTRWYMKASDIKAGHIGLACGEFPTNASAVAKIHDMLRRRVICISISSGSKISEFFSRTLPHAKIYSVTFKRTAWFYSNFYILQPTKCTLELSFRWSCSRLGPQWDTCDVFITRLVKIQTWLGHKSAMKSIINQFAGDSDDGILRLAYSVSAVCPWTLILIRTHLVGKNWNTFVIRWKGEEASIELCLLRGAVGNTLN
jgi:hypothetical protein